MAPIPEDRFADRLRDLPLDRMVTFVADLWAARGYETHTEGDSVIAVRNGERTRLVCQHGTGRWGTVLDRLPGRERSLSIPDGSADIVVITASAWRVRRLDKQLDARVIGVDTLRNLLLYAISPQQGNALCREYFDRPARMPTEMEPTGWTRTRGGRIAVLGAIGVTVLLVTGGIIGAPGMTGLFGIGAQSPETDVGTPSFTETAGTPLPPTSTATPEPRALPPGLSESGIANPETLIDAHLETIVGRSYTWTITYQVFVRGEGYLKRQEEIRVRQQSRYVTNLSGDTVTGPADPTANVSAYADGDFRYTKNDQGNETRYRRTLLTYRRDGTRYAIRAQVLLAKYLWGNYSTSVSEARRNGEPVYILTLVGENPDQNVSTRTTAVIGPDGFIRDLQRKYVTSSPSETTIVVSLRYTDIGTTTVEAPPWYEAAKNATAETEG
ncbi:MAG: hypothetical protein ABEH65_11815 [Halobacteriales archaeon]